MLYTDSRMTRLLTDLQFLQGDRDQFTVSVLRGLTGQLTESQLQPDHLPHHHLQVQPGAHQVGQAVSLQS